MRYLKKVGEKLESYRTVSMLNILKCVGLAYVITLVIFLILAIILTYTQFPETMVPSAVIIGTVISILFAGSCVAGKAKTRGWLNGAIAGIVYMLILYIISSLIVGFRVDNHVIFMLILGTIAGALGGIVGINLK